jgi:enoyl-CoA hydratase
VAYETIKYEKENGIGIITLNRPERRNALNITLVREMTKLLDQMATDEDLKVVIITGGEEWFGAGADLREVTGASVLSFLEEIRTLFRKIENFDRPVIAAINGFCLAGGCEMAISCDLRVAAENATFGLPEIRFGALAIGGATQRLPRLIGIGKAKEMHYTGDPIDAQEAYRIGLINRLVPPESVMDEARKLANTLAQRSPIALKMAKFLINAGMRADLDTAMEFEAEVSKNLFTSSEAFQRETRKAAEREDVYRRIFG